MLTKAIWFGWTTLRPTLWVSLVQKSPFYGTTQILKGRLIKLPSDEEINLVSEGDIFHAVVITGNLNYTMPSSEVMSLDAGSYFTATDYANHLLSKTGSEETLIYIRTNGPFSILTQ